MEFIMFYVSFIWVPSKGKGQHKLLFLGRRLQKTDSVGSQSILWLHPTELRMLNENLFDIISFSIAIKDCKASNNILLDKITESCINFDGKNTI